MTIFLNDAEHQLAAAKLAALPKGAFFTLPSLLGEAEWSRILQNADPGHAGKVFNQAHKSFSGVWDTGGETSQGRRLYEKV